MMIAPIRCRAISRRALAIRCSRSAEVIGGGIAIEGNSAAACAIARSSGMVIAAASALALPRNARRSIEWIIFVPLLPALLHGCRQSASRRAPMFDSLSHDGIKRPGAREMTVMLAGLMALNAFAIDAMVPALPAIGRSLGIAADNDRQLVVLAYFVGFASTQLLWGPLADRFGRKPILVAGILLYSVFALLCALAGSFPLLIAGRVAM